MSPIGVGFIELDLEGRFHLQRLRLRPEFECHAVAATDQALEASSQTFGLDVVTPNQLLQRDDISLVWVGSAAGLPWIRSALEAGKHVLCGLPVDTPPQWREVLSTNPTSRSRVCVAALHRWDSRLQTVRSVLDSNTLGKVFDLRQISRQFVPGELSVLPNTAGQQGSPDPHQIERIESHLLQIQWFELLDELLQLVASDVTSVQVLCAGRGRAVWVTFADGCQAYLELNRRSLTPLETGWIIEGTRGGYGSGRYFRASLDHELIDVPVEPLPTNHAAFYDTLIASIRYGEPFPVTNESICRVIALYAAIESLVRTGGGVVEL